MSKSLAAIASIIMGATLREKPIAAIAGRANALLMQLGDLDTEGNILLNNTLPVIMEKYLERFVGKPGDLIFRGRGAGIVAAVMPISNLPIIASSPLMIIRPQLDKVDPLYLAWALTNNHARRHYAQHSRGSIIIGIGKHELELLEISLPDIEIQRKIGELKTLENQENQLLARHQKIRFKLLDKFITDVIHKEKTA